jgi:hypothetical protein
VPSASGIAGGTGGTIGAIGIIDAITGTAGTIGVTIIEDTTGITGRAAIRVTRYEAKPVLTGLAHALCGRNAAAEDEELTETG